VERTVAKEKARVDEVVPGYFAPLDQQYEKLVGDGKADALGTKSLEYVRGLSVH